MIILLARSVLDLCVCVPNALGCLLKLDKMISVLEKGASRATVAGSVDKSTVKEGS